jgi:hypothetical protein
VSNSEQTNQTATLTGQSTSAYLPSRMSGQCGEGERDGGKRYHAVPVGGSTHAKALCGAKPGRRSVGWGEHHGTAVTCPRCLKRLLK